MCKDYAVREGLTLPAITRHHLSGIGVRVHDRDVAKSVLHANSVPFIGSDGRIRVDSPHTSGLFMEFAAIWI